MDAEEEYPGLDRAIVASDLSGGGPEGRKKGGLAAVPLATRASRERAIGINGGARSRT